MHKKTKRVIGLVLSLAIIPAATFMAAPSNAADKITLTVWDPGLMGHLANGALDTKISFIYKAKVGYEKLHPNVTIKISELDGGVADTQFRAASIAKNGPDIKIGFAGGATLSFAQFLEPLDPYFSDTELSRLKGTGTVREDYKKSGSLLALPYGAGSYFYVFYDKRIMAANNINMATPPKTWEAFLALAKKLKDAGVKNPIWETNLEGYTGAWVIASLVGGLLGPNAFYDMYTGATSINSPAVVQAYTAYAKLYTSGVTNVDATTLSQGERFNGFTSGKGAMIIDGGWDNDGVYQALGANAGEFAIPTLAGSKYPGILAGGTNVSVALTNYSQHKAQAIDFMKYLTRPSTMDLYVATTQTEPSNNTHANPAVITNPLLVGQAVDVRKRLQVYPFDNIMPGPVCDLFYKLNASVGLGQTTPAAAAKQLAEGFAASK
jgi:raffinose/stachyose/melibiose transport system substrate-binding protein